MLEAERHQVAAASRRLAEQGLVVGTSGNLSARRDDRVAITPTGARLGDLRPEEVTVVDLDGRVAWGELAPTSELDLHLGVYRRYQAGAVVHTHSPLATALLELSQENFLNAVSILVGMPVSLSLSVFAGAKRKRRSKKL